MKNRSKGKKGRLASTEAQVWIRAIALQSLQSNLLERYVSPAAALFQDDTEAEFNDYIVAAFDTMLSALRRRTRRSAKVRARRR